MKTTLRFLNLNIHNSWYRILDQHVDHWQGLTAVTATDVVMERQRDGGPAFRVQVCLEVSGGNLNSEATARTLKAALLMASEDLEAQIQVRRAKRVERRAGNGNAAPSPAVGFILKPLVPEAGNHTSRSALAVGPAQPQQETNGQSQLDCAARPQ